MNADPNSCDEEQEILRSKLEREFERVHLRLDHLDAMLDLILKRSGGVPQKYTIVTDPQAPEILLLGKSESTPPK